MEYCLVFSIKTSKLQKVWFYDVFDGLPDLPILARHWICTGLARHSLQRIGVGSPHVGLIEVLAVDPVEHVEDVVQHDSHSFLPCHYQHRWGGSGGRARARFGSILPQL